MRERGLEVLGHSAEVSSEVSSAVMSTTLGAGMEVGMMGSTLSICVLTLVSDWPRSASLVVRAPDVVPPFPMSTLVGIMRMSRPSGRV